MSEASEFDAPLHAAAVRASNLAAKLQNQGEVLWGPERERLVTELVTATAVLRELTASRGLSLDGPTHAEVRAQVAAPSFTTFFQPIVWLPTREVVGFEALTRFDRWAPNLWFERAWDLGVGLELEIAAVRSALSAVDRLPEDLYLAINVSPLTLLSAGLLDLVLAGDAPRLVLELTEHERIADYDRFRTQVARLRSEGVRIAVDDAGAGHSSLQHIIELGPDIIKVDRSITDGSDLDPVRRALMTCLATFATDTRTLLVAEGVETERQADALVSYGVAFGQGYLFGTPGPSVQLTLEPSTGAWLASAL